MTVMGPDGLHRIEPALPVTAMKSYRAVTPMRPVTCEEYGCEHYLQGWQTIVPADSAAAEYIRHDKTRSHAETRQEGGLTQFDFGPGQKPFAGPAHEHRMPSGRPERLLVRGGDWRGNPRGDVRDHVRADDWIDDFATHQDRIKTQLEKG